MGSLASFIRQQMWIWLSGSGPDWLLLTIKAVAGSAYQDLAEKCDWASSADRGSEKLATLRLCLRHGSWMAMLILIRLKLVLDLELEVEKLTSDFQLTLGLCGRAVAAQNFPQKFQTTSLLPVMTGSSSVSLLQQVHGPGNVTVIKPIISLGGGGIWYFTLRAARHEQSNQRIVSASLRDGLKRQYRDQQRADIFSTLTISSISKKDDCPDTAAMSADPYFAMDEQALVLGLTRLGHFALCPRSMPSYLALAYRSAPPQQIINHYCAPPNTSQPAPSAIHETVVLMVKPGFRNSAHRASVESQEKAQSLGRFRRRKLQEDRGYHNGPNHGQSAQFPMNRRQRSLLCPSKERSRGQGQDHMSGVLQMPKTIQGQPVQVALELLKTASNSAGCSREEDSQELKAMGEDPDNADHCSADAGSDFSGNTSYINTIRPSREYGQESRVWYRRDFGLGSKAIGTLLPGTVEDAADRISLQPASSDQHPQGLGLSMLDSNCSKAEDRYRQTKKADDYLPGHHTPRAQGGAGVSIPADELRAYDLEE
ncbi:uncharacterized protein MYCFIDRAFT_180077 [Pseudocercospora fijiensis CIRAD86]|uniref:Uncharacterized protein n=1 Tax=Pseudocercospora fijiensis (strain CIRAD86) TaxID=383855 RepID=M2YH94_PSEFD|nr:uncharacterized protein MYCFIDRAFT_180077 [Pseudocercospora fijiensis CIRAD86]EME77200.1 hypothetical protein MYCFIDRAFT_180077 [Pseudocercospora fijiensis CIRAD86]